MKTYPFSLRSFDRAKHPLDDGAVKVEATTSLTSGALFVKLLALYPGLRYLLARNGLE
ncbi:MAG: hypothetical protein ACREX9_16830 [Gammaproteobacteria bacterium]